MPALVRATFFLPVTSENDRTAYLVILNHLRSRHPGSRHPETIGGFTSTTDDPPPFIGYYWSERYGDWVEDRIALLFVDIPEARRTQLDGIKAYVEKAYRESGSPQEEFWCTLERIETF